MNDKKGFTLVEIIVVIVLLVSVAGISIPIIMKNNEEQKRKEKEKIIENIKLSSEVFVETNKDINIKENKPYYIKLNVLEHTGLIELPIEDPITGTNITDNVCIEVTKDELGTLNYNIDESGSMECVNPEVKITTFNLDNSIVYLKKGATLDLNSYVLAYESNDPSSNLKINKSVSSTTTLSPGKYEVTYQIEDINNNVFSEEKTKTFYVVDLKFVYSPEPLPYIKKGNNLDLASYLNYSIDPPLSEMGLDASNLSYEQTGSININNVGTYNVGYKVKLNVGVESDKVEKEFEVVEDKKINITFLTDEKTKQDYNQSTINTWKTNLKDTLDATVSEQGIEYIINVDKIDTTITRNGPTYSVENGVSLFPSNTSDLKEVEYLGVFNSNIVLQARYTESRHKTIFVDINTGEKQTLNERCTYIDSENINCYNSDSYQSDCCIKGICETFRGTEKQVYSYKLSNGSYELIESATYSSVNRHCGRPKQTDYEPNSTTYNRIENNYTRGSTNWNTHTNLPGVSYDLNQTQMRNILKSIGYSNNNANKYSIDSDYYNVFHDGYNNKGYLIFKDSQGNVDGYTYAYILWERYTTTETFRANTIISDSKDYLVILANNTNNSIQNFNISNYDSIIIFSDDATRSNIRSSTRVSDSYNYISLQDALSKLNNIIK